MTKRTRSILFLIIVIIFIIITPVLLLYVQGYRFDFEELSFFRTGGIYLRTNPKKAQIFINDKLSKKKAPILINGLFPRNFNIKIEKEGFHPWEKRLKVESGLVTEAKNITLIPKKPKQDIIFDAINNISILPSKNYFLNIRNDYIDLIEKNETYPVNLSANFDNTHSKNEFIAALNSKNIAWDQNNKKLIAYLGQNNYIVDFSNKTITKFFVENTDLKESKAGGYINLKRIQWHPLEADSIILVHETDIYSYNLKNKESEKLIERGLYYKSASSVFTSNIYYIDDMGFVNKYNFTTKNIEKISKIPLPYNQSTELVISPDQKKIFLKDEENKKIYLVLENSVKTFEDIHFAEFSADSKKIVYGNKNKIWVMFLENDNDHPKKPKGAIEEIIGSDNENIAGVSWYGITNQHLWILAGDLYFTELDDRPTRNTYTVLKNIPQDTFVNNNEIYMAKNSELHLIDIGK